MERCETNKKAFSTQALAEDALISAWTTYEYKNNQGPVGVYRCDSCGAYHLTSKGEMNERLARFIASGDMKRNTEANRWIDKFHRKK